MMDIGILAELFDMLPVGVYITNEDTGIVYCNKALEAMSGIPKKDFISGLFKSKPFIAGDGSPLTRQDYPSTKFFIEGKSVYNIEFGLKMDDSSTKWFNANGVPLAEGGKSAIFIITDITGLKKAEQELKYSRDFAENILDTLHAIILVLDNKGRVVRFNKYFEELSGWKLKDAEGLDWFMTFLPEREQARIKNLFSSAVKGKHTTGNINAILTRDGREIDIEWYDKSLYNESGETIGLLSIGQDITQKKKTEETIRRTQKLESLGILAGGIAHDFNNLFTGIFGYIELAREVNSIDTVKEYLLHSMNSLSRARELTQQLLTFSKGGSPIREAAPLFPFLKESIQFMLSGSNISCHFDIPDDLAACSYNKPQLSQAVGNIIMNARQAMPDGGRLEVSARNTEIGKNSHPYLMDGSYIKLGIRDTGCGIAEEHIPRIFDPFFTTKKGNRGMGLAAAYSIINRHNGYIEAESVPQKGTVFCIYLPARDLASAHEAKTAPAAPDGRAKSNKILVMDDEQAIREITAKILKEAGYETVTAREGEEALRIFKAELDGGNTFAAVILDLTVPGGIGGLKALPEIRKLDPAIPAFVSSGYSDEPVLADPRAYGFTGSLCKPYTKTEIIALIKTYIP